MPWRGSDKPLLAFNKDDEHYVKLMCDGTIISMKKIVIISCALLMAGAVSLRAADAKETWDKSCAKCHGEDGKGKTKMGEKLGVKDYTDAKVQAELKEDKMAKAIKEGIKEDDKTK